MIDMPTLPARRHSLPLAVLTGLLLALLTATTALAATGGDWQAMLEACQTAMAATGIQINPEQMRAMMAGCMGR